MDVTDKEQYKIAVKYGVLKRLVSRNQFNLIMSPKTVDHE